MIVLLHETISTEKTRERCCSMELPPKLGILILTFFHPAFNPTQVLRTVTDHATPKSHPTPACPVQVVVTMGTQVPEVVAD